MLPRRRSKCRFSVSESQPVKGAAACAGGVCVCSDRRLSFQREQLTSFELDEVIDVVACWRGVDCHIAAADRGGCVHVFSPDLDTITHSQMVVPHRPLSDQPVFSALVALPETSDPPSLLLLAAGGTLYLLRFNATCREEAAEVFPVNVSPLQEPLHVCYQSTSSHILIVGRGVWPLAQWRLDKVSHSLSLSLQLSALFSGEEVPELVQVETVANNSYVVTLTQQGTVQVWLGEVMILVGVWGGKGGQPHVDQFSLSSYQEKHWLCVLYGQRSEVAVLDVPGLLQIFSSPVTPDSLLTADTSGEGAVCLLQPEAGGFVSLTVLECGSAEDRVAMLVSEGKFEEAELLVKEHNLDPQLVLSKKAAILNDQVCAGEEGKLPDLLHCLREMKDVKAAATLALDSLYPSSSTTHSILSALSSEPTNWDCSAVVAELDRLTTFCLIFSEDRFREQWPLFRSEPFLAVVTRLLQAGRLLHARILWARHQQALEDDLGKVGVSSLLQIVPTNLHLLVSWLPSTIFPFILSHCPEEMKAFLVELSSVLCSQEHTEHWPGNVLCAVEKLLTAIADLSPSPGCPPDLSPLIELREKLARLASMPAIMCHNLSFLSFQQLTPANLVFRALDRTRGQEDIEQLITGPLRQFADAQQIPLDTLLADYLKLFLARAPTHSPDFPGSSWESKVVAVVRSVANSEVKVACCLELVHSITAPWSSAAASLINECLQLTSSNSEELHNLYNLLQMQIVLQEKYGIVDFNFSDSNTGEVYIRRILQQQLTGGLADALWVASKYGLSHSRVYVRHLFRLCSQDQIERARCVMNSLSPDSLTRVTKAALSFSFCQLKLPFLPRLCQPAIFCAAAHLALLCIQFNPTLVSWTGECTALSNVLDLVQEFSLYLSPSQLGPPQKTSQLLLQFLANLSPSHTLPRNALRLGHLLGYSEQEVWCQLVKIWLQQNYKNISLSLLERYPADFTSLQLHSLLHASLERSLLTPSLSGELVSLSARVSSTCTHDKLHMALLVFRVCCLLCEMCGPEQEDVSCPWISRQAEQRVQTELSGSLLHLATALLQPYGLIRQDTAGILAVVDQLQSSGHLNIALCTTVECLPCLGAEGRYTFLLSSLLEKVLSMSQVDHSYGLALLLATPTDTALRLLHTKQASILSSYSRVIALCAVTTDYCHLVGQTQISRSASTLMSGAVWGKLLRKYQINFSDAFRSGTEEKKRLLSQLLHHKHISPGTLLAYCRTYGLDGAGAMLTRLRLILTDWEDGYQQGFSVTRACIRSHPFIPSLLQTFLHNKVCPYDYERIQFVLREMEHRHHRQHHHMQQLLPVLLEYGERRPPSESERTWHSANCHGVCRAGKPFSPQRLPLHLLLDPSRGLELLCREVQNPSLLDKLMVLAGYLDIPEEKFYPAVVRSLDMSQLSYSELKPLLTSISHVPTLLDLTVELAAQLSGADQVAALEAALATSADSQNLHSIEHQLKEAKTSFLLEEAGVNQYVTASDPSVVSALFSELPLQLERPAPAVAHQLAQKIADIQNVNVLALTSQRLQEWLFPAGGGQQDLNITLVRELEEVEKTAQDCSSSDNWKRMVYLLTDNPHIDHLASVLYNWAKADSPVVGPSPRHCALQLLLTAVPRSVVERITGRSVASLREKVQESVFVTELASVQVALKIEEFHTLSKDSVVCGLLQNRPDSPKALRLASELCLHYGLSDPELWTRLLSALLALNMTRFVMTLLPKLVRVGVHCSVASFSSVWQKAVQTAYEKGGESDYLPALCLLYQCPVLHLIDLSAIIHTMTVAGALSHALAASLLLASLSMKLSKIHSLLSVLPPEGLVDLLEEVSTSSCPHLSLVADEVYDFVDRSGQHQTLLASPYFSCLVKYLIADDRISSLLATVLSKGRLSEAAQLVEMYHSHHDISASPGADGLKEYLKNEGIQFTIDHVDNSSRQNLMC